MALRLFAPARGMAVPRSSPPFHPSFPPAFAASPPPASPGAPSALTNRSPLVVASLYKQATV
jgi:hypothetical protein